MRLAMQIFGVFALQFHKFQTHLQERLHERIFLKTEETMVHAPISNGTRSVYILQIGGTDEKGLMLPIIWLLKLTGPILSYQVLCI